MPVSLGRQPVRELLVQRDEYGLRLLRRRQRPSLHRALHERRRRRSGHHVLGGSEVAEAEHLLLVDRNRRRVLELGAASLEGKVRASGAGADVGAADDLQRGEAESRMRGHQVAKRLVRRGEVRVLAEYVGLGREQSLDAAQPVEQGASIRRAGVHEPPDRFPGGPLNQPRVERLRIQRIDARRRVEHHLDRSLRSAPVEVRDPRASAIRVAGGRSAGPLLHHAASARST